MSIGQVLELMGLRGEQLALVGWIALVAGIVAVGLWVGWVVLGGAAGGCGWVVVSSGVSSRLSPEEGNVKEL